VIKLHHNAGKEETAIVVNIKREAGKNIRNS
jgi:hypothetical protein